MGQRAPRLYRKPSGVYWLRIVLPGHAQPSTTTGDHAAPPKTIGKPRNPKNRIEIRRSLRTTDYRFAHRISSVINALLAQAQPNHWKTIVNHLLSPGNISTWTAGPNGISTDGPEDQQRMEEFFRSFGDIRTAIAASLGTCNSGASRSHSSNAATFAAPFATSNQAVTSVQQPTRISDALDAFIDRASEANKARTAQDQANLVEGMVAFLHEKYPDLGSDPWVHAVSTMHLSKFIDAQKKRIGKRVDAEGNPQPISASTLRKNILDLRVFFAFASEELNAREDNPVSGLKKRAKQLGKVASAEKEPYLPFTDSQITVIFEPKSFLEHNRDPDYFWCPLLGLFLGGRLGDYVRTRLSDIGMDSNGIWYIDVTEGKNTNSIRRLPIPASLIDIGFLDYVDHVRRLGATHLWPHRDLTSPTAKRLPSKNQSNHFGAHLTKLGMVDPRLVFHSFRHTAVSALLDGGTPVHLSMQICGHEAQADAVKRELITEAAARSVHLGTYAHADLVRMGTAHPLQSMKDALERCITPPINHKGLRLAAQIVLQHTRKVGGAFRTGWPAQRASYTAEQIAKLDHPASSDGVSA